MDPRDVAVVLPVRDEATTLADAVQSVLHQEVPAGLEVCLAVGPSADDTRSVAKNLAGADPRIAVVDNPVGVTPAGLNAAIRATTAPIVVRVDGHAELPEGYGSCGSDTGAHGCRERGWYSGPARYHGVRDGGGSGHGISFRCW